MLLAPSLSKGSERVVGAKLQRPFGGVWSVSW